MFDLLFENIRRSDEIESKLFSIFEGKNWGYIAKVLYQILDSIEVSNDVCKESVEAFCSTVRRLHAKKNQYLHPVNEKKRVCENCENWRSFRDVYEDELEPNDIGFCRHLKAPHDKVTSSSESCSISECVCHIYDMDDDELLEFYNNTMLNPEHYVSVGAQKQFPLDKAEVEEEIVKRRLQKEARLTENLVDHARRELKLAGMFDEDVDGSEAAGNWNNLVAEAVIELMDVFAEQGHSGFSASMTQELFSRLAKYESLTELTDSIDEWQNVTDFDPRNGESLHQSRRSSSCFSNDEGKSYWDINEDWFYHEDENGERWSGGLPEEEWDNRPMHQSKHVEKKES